MTMEKRKGYKYKLSHREQELCVGIIRTASVSTAAVGAGFAQLPLADNVIITPIQITMIISLGGVFDKKIKQTLARSLLAGFVARYNIRGIVRAK